MDLAFSRQAVTRLLSRINLLRITPHGRSGSLFMQSLLDGHEACSVLLGMNGYAEGEAYDEGQIDSYVSGIKHNLSSRFSSYFSSVGTTTTGLFGPNATEHTEVNGPDYLEAFHAIFRALGKPSISRREFNIIGYLAADLALGRDIERIRYIVLHLHGARPETQHLVSLDFPDFLYLAMIRDPREEWNGWRKVLARNHRQLTPGDIWRHTRSVTKNYQELNEIATELGRRVYFVDLNALHRCQLGAMRLIADWLGVDMGDSLGRSTFFGKLWPGNAADGATLFGFDSSRVAYRFPSELPEPEAAFIEAAFRPLFEKIYSHSETLSVGDSPLREGRVAKLHGMVAISGHRLAKMWHHLHRDRNYDARSPLVAAVKRLIFPWVLTVRHFPRVLLSGFQSRKDDPVTFSQCMAAVSKIQLVEFYRPDNMILLSQR